MGTRRPTDRSKTLLDDFANVRFRPEADTEDPALVADEVFLPSGTFRVLPAGRFSA